MIKEPVYCSNCEVQIALNIFGKPKAYSFKDGQYCEACALKKVKEARK